MQQSSSLIDPSSSSSSAQTNSREYAPHHRIVLLFDLDCFYAQCERVRLGLPEDVSLALLQWNSVLAVTYPARHFGIKRGDSWEAVAEKSNNACWAIHLHILEKNKDQSAIAATIGNITPVSTTTATTATTTTTVTTPNRPPVSTTSATKPRIANPYLKKTKSPSDEGDQDQPPVVAANSSASEDVIPPDISATTGSDDTTEEPDEDMVVANIEEAFDQIYKLSRDEQLECQKRERGLRRFHQEGKACLERYRLASMRIFGVVLESLTERLGGKDYFTLERASIDEFYLDITKYCYQNDALPEMTHQSVVVGVQESFSTVSTESLYGTSDLQTLALQRACQVSHWVRQDVFRKLGFTMSAGICTNKMMAKLAASYGKPNGQGVLHPRHFPAVLQTTKVRKVRHFGGKLGKQVLRVLHQQATNPTTFDGDLATMGDLQQVPLPTLQQHFTDETANFVFEACRGVDQEAVKETTGALVKSITAFKSFPATSQIAEIQNWLTLMSNEVVTRVAKDSARNHRYPKTCTLNYTYYTTDTGKRPTGVTSTRSFRNSKSLRLNFPHEKSGQKAQDLVSQAMQKLVPILKQHALRGVGLSASNFETRGCPPEGVKGISTFLVKKDDHVSGDDRLKPIQSQAVARLLSKRKRKPDIEQYFSQQPTSIGEEPVGSSSSTKAEEIPALSPKSQEQSHMRQRTPFLLQQQAFEALAVKEPIRSSFSVGKPANLPLQEHQESNDAGERKTIAAQINHISKTQADRDEEVAKKLQASFDRENYILSAADRFRPSSSNTTGSASRSSGPTKTSGAMNESSGATSKGNARKVRRIDSFFGRK